MLQYLPYAVPVVVVIALLAIIASGYVKAPPDTAYIISGFKKHPKVLIGRAGIKIPFLERKDTLMLKQISIDIKTNGYIPTYDFIGVNIDAVAKVSIKKNPEGIELAMQNFLNMNEKQICECLTDSLQGNMREIVGTVKLKELCNDRKQFGDQVQEKAQQDMDRLGIQIISCNIQKLEDEKGLIIALGQDNMSQIQKDASIAKANAERDVAIAEAEAAKQANAAKVQAQTEIAQRNNELTIRQAELKKEADVKKAEADAAYQIQQESQRKTLEVRKAEADVAKQEMEVTVKQKAAAVKEQELNANIRKQAEAEKYRKEQDAQADLFRRQRNAEAEAFEAMKKAEALKAKADADKYMKEQEAEAVKAKGIAEAEALKAQGAAEAEAIRAKGIAEAEAIRAKGIAEAEAIDKKAVAMQKMQEAAILEMFFKAMPEVAKAVAEPLANIDSITMYGDGNTPKLMRDITNTTVQASNGLFEGLGIDLKGALANVLLKSGVEAQEAVQQNEQEAEENEDPYKEA